jgi:hypothetical protein
MVTIFLDAGFVRKQNNSEQPVDVVRETVRLTLLPALTPVHNVLNVPPPQKSEPLSLDHANPTSRSGQQWQLQEMLLAEKRSNALLLAVGCSFPRTPSSY